MIKITSFGSGSSGNCYLIDDGSSQLLIECGVRFELVKQKMRFNLSKVAGMLITHEHGDHSKEINKVLKTSAIEIYASKGTIDALKVPSFRSNTMKNKVPYKIGTWTVTPFDIKHDVTEPFGFLIDNQVGERLLFLTDTKYSEYYFEGITHMMVEANYSIESLVQRMQSGQVVASLKSRVMQSHFEFENTKSFIKANMSDKLQEVWLIHLSDGNSDEAQFKRDIQALTGVPVYIA
ncbi:MBL fold metallo-hydrolase [Jeotgalibaca porci]|uniref:MBL fold metallo-hydrolase n=2 Tax=Jeotgalibaca porci TaxID=1868793 RepID=UPI0035A06BB8